MKSAFPAIFLAMLPAAAPADIRDLAIPSPGGSLLRPADPGAGPFAVIVFVTTDCPVANAFQPELRRLAVRAADLGGRFTLVHVGPEATIQAVLKHREDFGVRAEVAIDREHELVKATGAEMVPEAVVIDRSGALVYRGRISNLFVTYGKRRAEATEHDLRDAMEAVAGGRAVKRPRTEATGCFIPGR